MSTSPGKADRLGIALSLHGKKPAADVPHILLREGLVTLSVNHATVEDPGHHAALLVIELQRDSLEDRKIHDSSLEGRVPILSAKSSPGLCLHLACGRKGVLCPSCHQESRSERPAWRGYGRISLYSQEYGRHKHHHPLMELAPGPQHLPPMAEISSDLLPPSRPPCWYSSTCPSAPECHQALGSCQLSPWAPP